MRKNEPPQAVSAMLDQDGKLVYHSCTCVAGEGLCCHKFALLYTAAHYSTLGQVPETRSCTSIPQAWHQPRRDGLFFLPVQDVVVKNPLSRSQKVVSSTLHMATNDVPPWQSFCPDSFEPHAIQLASIIPLSTDSVPMTETAFGNFPVGSILSYQQPKASSPVPSSFPPVPTCNLFPTFVNCPLCLAQHCVVESLHVDMGQARKIEEDTRLQSACQSWHRLRRLRLTASTFGRVCKCVKGLEELAKSIKNAKVIQTPAMKRGLEFEQEAADAYARVTGATVHPCGLVPPGTPWLACSPDRRVCNSQKGENGLLEIKCPVSEIGNLKFLDSSGVRPSLRRNHDYFHQIMGQLGITGLPWCDLFMYTPAKTMMIERIHFDGDFFHEMQLKLEKFYFEYFLPHLAANK